MERESVKSSMISSVGYQAATKILEIEFNSGAVWQYCDFPKSLWNKFKKCDSYGRFFRDYIQDSFEEAKVGRKRY